MKKRKSFVYVSSQDYLSQNLELPALSPRDRDGFIRMRLARYFPDPLADNPVTVLGKPRDGVVTAIFTSRASLDSYRSADPETPLACLLSLGAFPSQSCLRVALHPGWTERAGFRDGRWERPDRLPDLPATEEAAANYLRAAFASGDERPDLIDIVYFPGAIESAKILSSAASGGFGVRSAIRSIDQAFKRLDARKDGIFPPLKAEPPKKSGAKASLAFVCVVVAALNAVIAASAFDSSKKAKRLSAELAVIQEAVKSEKKIKEEIAAYGPTDMETGPAYSARSVLGAIALSAPASARIKEFAYEDGRFTVVMEAADALAVLAALEKNGVLTGLSVSGIQPKNGSERFTLKGSAR